MNIVGAGRTAYLWWGNPEGHCCGHISGTATLRRFARLILEAIETKPKKKPRKP